MTKVDAAPDHKLIHYLGAVSTMEQDESDAEEDDESAPEILGSSISHLVHLTSLSISWKV